MSNVVKGDGSVEIPNNNLGLTLVNIEEEGIVRVLPRTGPILITVSGI